MMQEKPEGPLTDACCHKNVKLWAMLTGSALALPCMHTRVPAIGGLGWAFAQIERIELLPRIVLIDHQFESAW